MDKNLEDKLYQKYPKIFKQKDLTIQESCMPWGICVANGWYWLIDNLCETIQDHIDANEKNQIEAVQVKEKFGGLRFYVSEYNEYVNGMIHFAEDLSFKICELCGSTENIVQTKGWIKSLCENCINKEKEKNETRGETKKTTG